MFLVFGPETSLFKSRASFLVRGYQEKLDFAERFRSCEIENFWHALGVERRPFPFQQQNMFNRMMGLTQHVFILRSRDFTFWVKSFIFRVWANEMSSVKVFSMCSVKCLAFVLCSF